jgi:chromosomal replication initiation ATPase DnaA
MAEIHIDELERAIVILKVRANEQKQRLQEDLPTPVAAALRDSLRSMYDNIYRMSAVRDAMNVREPFGFTH